MERENRRRFVDEVEEAEYAAHGEFRDRLSRATALFIVLATLAAAVAGFLLALASRSADAATTLAQRRAIEAADEARRSSLWAQLQFSSYVQSQEELGNAAEAARGLVFANASEDKARFRFEQQRWTEVAGQTERLTRVVGSQETGLQLDGSLGPAGDPGFPLRFMTESTKGSVRQQGLQDASNQLSNDWGGKSTTYIAILTLFAVALYLLGFSQVLRRRARRVLAVMGVVVIAVGAAWSGIEATNRPALAPDAAAARFADAEVALSMGSDAYDKAFFRQAERDFTAAIQARPTYAAAYADRSEAEFSAESPQSGGFVSISTQTALERAVADDRTALRLGLRNLQVLGDADFDEYELAVLSGNTSLLQESLRLTREAEAVAPRDAPIAFNGAVALLASGRSNEARSAYRRASALARDDGLVVSGAFTDLEFLRAHRPSLSGEIDGIEQLITQAAFPDASAGPSVTETGMKVVTFPGSLSLQEIQIPNFDTNRKVVLYWLYEDPRHLGTFVVPEMSGPTFLTRSTDGSLFVDTDFLAETSPARCLPTGTYRAELFVGGKLAGSSPPVPLDFSGLKPEVLHDVDVAMCVPSDWQPTRTVQGVVEGFSSSDGTEGLYVLQINEPPGSVAASVITKAAVKSSVDTFSGGLLPKGLTPEKGIANSYFLGLDGGFTQYYDYPGGNVLIGAGVDKERQTVLVGAIFGPAKEFATAGQGLIPVLDSVVKYSSF